MLRQLRSCPGTPLREDQPQRVEEGEGAEQHGIGGVRAHGLPVRDEDMKQQRQEKDEQRKGVTERYAWEPVRCKDAGRACLQRAGDWWFSWIDYLLG
ncbi:hypothetical protein LJK88_35670 [Paenibacillus sp. P26]|nr:hypothetical protein LJK88_35670 [Paenibacillus sp. P26]